jgi:hypothetical protein
MLRNREEVSLLKVDKIKIAIEELPEEDFVQLRQWFWEKDWQKWDRQIEIDSESGRLDFLIEEALNEKKKGKLREL